MHCFCFRVLISSPSLTSAFWFSNEEIHTQPDICYNHNKIDFGVVVKVIFHPTKSNSFIPIQLSEMNFF